MLTGKIPFKDENENKLVQRIVYEQIDFFNDKWSILDIEAIDLVENLLEKNADDRYTIDDILNHSWVGGGTTLQSNINSLSHY